MNRKAPNNQFPATHYMEAFNWGKSDELEYTQYPLPVSRLKLSLSITARFGGNTIALFKIRENKVSTLHNFNQ